MAPPRSGTARRLAWIFTVAAFATVTASVGPRLPVAASQAGERILDFNVELHIERDGSLLVRETIAYDFAGNRRHGIERFIPVRLRYDERYDRVYPLDLLTVEVSPGTPGGYTAERAGDFERIRIGDPDRTITGVHTYTLAYRLGSALNGFRDHVELYWNAVGTRWNVPVERARVRVDAPVRIDQVACFAGPVGSSLPCPDSAVDGSVAHFSSTGLRSFEGLSVVVGIPSGAVPAPAPRLDERWSARRAFAVTAASLGATVALLVLVLGVLTRLAWRAGRDRRFRGSPVDAIFGTTDGADQAVSLLERPVTPVEFAPPDKLRPGQVGTLVDERANALDVIATIVDLAVQGYLRIEEIPKEGWFGKPDWSLIKLKEMDALRNDTLRNYEKVLLLGLFKDGDEVKLSALRNTFAERLDEVQDALYDDAVEQRWFAARPDRVRQRWAVIGAVVAALGGALVVAAAAFTHLGLVPIPVLFGGLLLMAGSRWMPRRTARGTAVLRRVHGFRRFIDESEAERARFAERQHLFSEYLPYAIVFGCTEKWAKAFAGLDGQVPDVSWYAGSHAFTATSFADSLDGFTVTTAGTLASTPSGSGSSGFGSGGFSGGGGGGGGGGSW